MIEHTLGNISVVGNAAMKCRSEILDKFVTGVIKTVCSNDHCKEHMQHKYGEKCDVIDTEAKDLLSSSTSNMIKCTAGINHYGEILKKIDKHNKTAACPGCGADEDWEHVILCEKSKENREELMKALETK